MIVVLTVISVIAALLLGVTYSVTKGKILAQDLNAEKEALCTVLPAAVNFSDKITGTEIEYYKGTDKDGNAAGYAFVGEGKGYSSILRIMIGVDTACNVRGIKIISQNETPGLGTRVNEVKTNETLWSKISGKKIETETEPWFQAQFRTKKLEDVDIITGASVTSNAVKDIVKKTVEKFGKEPKS